MRPLLYIFILFLSSCAIQVPPGGGEKDTKPPELIGSNPEPFATNFSGNSVQLDFNEYVQVKDASTQLVVSPLLKQNPVVKIRKKSVIISFEEDTLLPNTTYTMNFGSSLVDVNEGNAKDDFQFVFSTGDHIDSLAISGKVFSGKTLNPEGGLIVLLYRTANDSLPFLSRPDYFAKTDKEGNYRIRNIAPGNYKVVAIKDADSDYKYSPAVESIGFVDTAVHAGDQNVNMKIFTERPALKLAKAQSDYAGKASIVFTRSVKDTSIQWLSNKADLNLHTVKWSKDADTLSFYYMNRDADSISVKIGEFPKDTVTIRLIHNSTKSGRGNAFTIVPDQADVIAYWKSYSLSATRPLSAVDTSKISLLEDSLPVKFKILITDSLKGAFQISYDWKQKKSYRLKLYPSSVSSLYFDQLTDTLSFLFSTKSETDYGSVVVRLDSLQGGSYIIQLVDENDNMYYEKIAEGSGELNFNLLDPRNYRVKMILDKNQNKKWDAGDYLNHIQPEQVIYYPETITVRANWDVDISWKPRF